jgi:hypothetical protein
MVKLAEAFPSKWLKPDDVDPSVVATIKAAAQENIKGLDGKEQEKTVLYFAKKLKPLPLNRTNFESVMDICGSDDSDDFPGTKIELFKQPNVRGPNGLTDGVRIRAPGAAKSKKAAPDGGDEKPPYNDEIPL